MRTLFWNVRGLGKSNRRKLVKEHILLEELDIVALQETIKQDFDDWELKEMAGNQDFSWRWSPVRGHLGGMILGIRNDDFEIEQVELGTYFLATQIRNRNTNFRSWVVNVYGPAQHENSGGFLQELSDFCGKENLPILLGGDFNLIRCDKERNTGQGDQKLMTSFNDFIGKFHLRELFILGAKFTWSNKQKHPIMVKLERILATGD
jgi:exonuclease III